MQLYNGIPNWKIRLANNLKKIKKKRNNWNIRTTRLEEHQIANTYEYYKLILWNGKNKDKEKLLKPKRMYMKQNVLHRYIPLQIFIKTNVSLQRFVQLFNGENIHFMKYIF